MNQPRKFNLRPLFAFAILTLLIAVGTGMGGNERTDVLALESSATVPSWTHLTSKNGDIDPPSESTQQTASLILDIDKDGLNDLVIGARRSPGPSMVWYKRLANGWQRYVIDSTVLKIEAGGAFHDIDNDGDLDVVMGGDSGTNQVWWWENPYPVFNPTTEWTRHLIKNSGGTQHHDQMFGDFDDDGNTELVFWNQGDSKLILAEIPADPQNSSSWSLSTIYSWSGGLSHEGLAQADIDLDGLVDIIGGGRWFKYDKSSNTFAANVIDDAQTFGRVAAGQLIAHGRPEVVFSSGDGVGPLKWYSWNGSSWIGTALLGSDIDHGHSLQLEDINIDGNLDIFTAEMRLNGGNSDAKMWLLLGDGSGGFTNNEIASGFGNHETKIADLDGDGDLDILGKPYNWDTPRLDIWLNNTVCHPSFEQWERHLVDSARPERAIFVYPGDLDGDGLQDIVSGAWWYRNPGSASGSWERKSIGSPLNNVATVYDFDKDGDLDILGTEGVGSQGNDRFVWANNNGAGTFRIRDNIDTADGDFLQGVAVGEFVTGNTEVALSWHAGGKGVQVLDVPSSPANGTWSWREISSVSQDEGLSSGDIDRDGDRDILLGTKWLRNDANSGAGNDWADAERGFRAPVMVDMSGHARSDHAAELSVNFTTLIASAGQSGTFDADSIRLTEVDGSSNVVNYNVPFQFDQDADFDADSNAAGTLVVMLTGDSAANATRHYHLYFDLQDAEPATPVTVAPQVTLTDDVDDEGQASYEIQTDTAAYYYQKESGGFSSLVDSSGNDWISHNSSAGSAGDFRGIPNLVHPNDGGYFHPGRSGVVSSVLSQGPLKATVHSRTSDNNWELLWEIYPDYARMTVLAANSDYWFLYEGTPGGLLETDSDFVVRSDGTQTLTSETWVGDIASPEWIFFGDQTESRSLYFVQHEDDANVDSYYPMNDEMTVFGFGRDGNSRYLTQVPSRFTFGFAEQTSASGVASILNGAYQPLSISLGAIEMQTYASSSGPWSAHDLFIGAGDPDRNRLIDMNDDGRLDAVVGYEAISTEGKLAWYEQPSVATELWTERIIANDVIGPMSLDVADMDNDGDIDVVVGEHDTTNSGTPRLLVYENPGTETGAWTAHTVYTGDEHHDGAQLVDIDNDGDLDIISIGWTHDDVLLYENTSCAGSTQPPATATPTGATTTPVDPTNTPIIPTNTPVAPSDTTILYLSPTSGGTISGISFTDEDILAYDTESSTWSLFFDGSDVGLSGSSTRDIDAFHLFDNNNILFSITAASTLPDVGSVDDSDIIQFVPTSLGNNTSGSFSIFLDGSDIGLDDSDEDIDAFTVLDNGDLIISTLGSWSTGGLSGMDEDLLRFTPSSTGANSSGAWSLFFDGSDVGLANTYHEDIVALWSEPGASALYLSTFGPFAVSGASGDSADILRCLPASLGSNSSCSFDLFWDGSSNGFAAESIDGLTIRPAGSGGTPATSTPDAPTATPEAPTATPEAPTATPDAPTATPEAPTATPEAPTATPEAPTATPEAPTATPEAPTATPEAPTATPEAPTSTPDPGGETTVVYLSATGGGTVNGVSYADEDILAHDTESGAWSLFIDGSDVGLSGSNDRDVDAFHLLDDNSLLFSIVANSTLPDVGSVEDSDIIQFVPAAVGNETSGSFSLFFDGSDVGLDDSNEDIDAFTVLENGDLVISTLSSWDVGGLSGMDEDLLRFTPASTGANTSGSWSLFFDGSDVGLADTYHEDIVALWAKPDASALYLSTYGPFAVSGASGDSADILRCLPSSLGSDTACGFDLFWDGSSHGFTGENIDGLTIRSAGSGSTPATATPDIPTSTPDVPTSTPDVPTATPDVPTATPDLPTATPDAPTATPDTPTATPEAPTATPTSSGGSRVTQDLLALYTFAEGSSTMVTDVSNVGAPLNLEISGNTSWLPAGGLVVNSSSSISSPGAASKIINAVKTSDALSFEVWIKPANITQDGPARIASISGDLSNRNLTLGQGLWGSNPSDLFDVRLRTAETDTNGQPSLTTSAGSASTQLQHLVFTYGNGQRRIYRDGLLIVNSSLGGDLNNWDSTYPLILANEVTGDRPWLGELHLVAVYSRDLTAAQVTENYEAGAHPGSGGTADATATPDIPTPTPGGPTSTPTAAPTSTPVPGDDTPVLYLSSTSGGTVGGVSFSDEDILAYDTDSGAWSLFMDGSNVGLDGSSNRDIDAFHLLDDNSILFSIVSDTTLPDVGSVDASDIIQFVPTALGNNTAGSFSLFFDGSDVGLEDSNENIDAFTLLGNGDLIISTLSSWSVGGLSGLDEDLLRFTPASTGANTSGSWSLFFDGSDVGLADTYHEDIVALWAEPDATTLFLSTYGPFAVSGVSGDSADILRCSPSSLGSDTACDFDLFWDGSGAGFAAERIDGLTVRSAGSGSAPPINTPEPPTATPGSGGGSSTEMIVYDWNDLVTKAEKGFPRHTPPTANGDWTQPTNFAEGTLYFRVEVRSQPVAQEMRLQYCVWQDRNALENCADWTTVFGNPGTVVTWSDKVTDMWMKDGNSIDWSRARYKDGLAIKNSQNQPVSTFQGWDWNGEDPDEWYPIDWRFLVVVVAKGETFSGWHNYN